MLPMKKEEACSATKGVRFVTDPPIASYLRVRINSDRLLFMGVLLREGSAMRVVSIAARGGALYFLGYLSKGIHRRFVGPSEHIISFHVIVHQTSHVSELCSNPKSQQPPGRPH